MRRSRIDSRTGASALVYVVLLIFALFEQFGRTTSDTKTPLIERPAEFLRGATTLWDPVTNFGELQNQAYGYLFPQGPFFLLGQFAHVPPWITERLWTVLVIACAVEGMRLLAGQLQLDAWAAWVAGMAYGLDPRILSQAAVRSAEILPTAVLPWVALPIVLPLRGRIGPRRAVLFSSAAFMFGGAVNGTATAAGLPLVVILMIWGARRKLVGWSMLGWWSGAIVVTNFWWAASLLRLNSYSPPFFDFVEDARATTETTGYAASLRGLSNWVDYAFLGSSANWPAGYSFSYQPVLVLLSGVLAAVGVVGLVTFRPPWRAPLVTSAVLGLVCLTIAHTSPLESPVGPSVQRLLDGGFALLRNVSKADPLLRLPLCLGVGSGFASLLGCHRLRSTRLRAVSVGALVLFVLSMAEPALAMNMRTPGWKKVPDYWSQTADYLARAPGEQRSWLVPGSGFGLQTWGWTMDEPFQGVARTPWVSRSQVPLTPPTTIRILSTIERFLESGSGSPNLGLALGRLGIGYVTVRHDLDQTASETTTSNLVSIALARSRGVERVKTLGALDFGPAIEIYRVTSSNVAPELEVRPLSEVVTTATASSDVIDGVVEGLITRRQPAVVQGDDGWDEPAQLVGDSYRARERNFGRVHFGDGPVRAAGEPLHGGRVVPDYPANAGSEPVRAVYDDGAYVTASSSQAWTNGVGKVMPETAPYAAVDGDPDTGWRSAYSQRARGQWLEVRWPKPHDIGRVRISTPVDDADYADVTRWTVTAASKRVTAAVNPFTGLASVNLTGVQSKRLRISVEGARGDSRLPVFVNELRSASTPVGRTLLLPRIKESGHPSFVFSAQPETRACIATLIAPDCQESRRALSEETTGMDRTFVVPEGGSWSLSGTAVARSRPETDQLLNPLGSHVVLHASSQWLSDPAVSVRLAYDGATTTSWIADPRDGSPVLTVDFDKPRRIDRISVAPPAPPAVSPTEATIRSKHGTRRVRLGAFGQFRPLRTDHLTITLSNRTRGLAPIGISELYLPPTKVATPLDGGDVTGSVCGLGPVLRIEGRRYRTQVRGFIGDVVSAGPLHFKSCSGPVRLGPGRHRFRLRSTEQFQPVTALMRSTSAPTAKVGTARSLSSATGPVTHQTMRVGAGGASMLSTTRNTNRGWVATLDGKTLHPMVSDGWAQAWKLPAGKGGKVVIRYAPQLPYLVSLYGGLALAGLMLLFAFVLLLRTTLVGARDVEIVQQRASRLPGWLLGILVALPVSWVLGGIPALVGVILGAVVRRRVLLRWMAFGCLVGAPALVAYQLLDGPRLRFDVADGIAGVGFTLALMSLAPAMDRGR